MKEGTVNNEFMNKKSSKKCCIFRKQKSFKEDNSDDEINPKGYENEILLLIRHFDSCLVVFQ
jgi:hypothetical protein